MEKDYEDLYVKAKATVGGMLFGWKSLRARVDSGEISKTEAYDSWNQTVSDMEGLFLFIKLLDGDYETS